ncbi:hypothetical protein CNR22_07500 [Sphingobacteriaceae bacterium]|nr:hypothetical protein CNR22_07500 [Sphingobacteriaceae bacterium]
MKLYTDKKYLRLFLNGLSILTLVTLVFAIFSKLPEDPLKLIMYFCSDTLYLPSIYRDLFIDHSDISDWHFNPAPNYFPDMGVYFLLNFISQNFIIASFLFSFAQCLFLSFILVKLFRLIFPLASPFYTLFIYTFLCLFLLEFFFFSKNFINVFFLLVNAYHTGAFLMTLLCAFFTFKYINGKNGLWLLLLLVTGFLSVISDRLFLVFFSAPMIASCLLLIKRLNWKPTTLLTVAIITFSWLGLKVFKQIDSFPYPMLDETKPADFSIISMQAEIYFDQISTYLLRFGFMALTMYLFIVSLFLMAYVFLKSIRHENDKLISFYSLFSLIFSVCVILTPLVSGRYTGGDCLRYNVYPFYLGILNLAVFIMFLSRGKQANKVLSFSLVGLNLIFFMLALTQISPKGINEFFNYYPKKAQQMDALAEKEHLHQGVANYWDAKVMTMFSKKGVIVRAVFDNISVHKHVANENWYFENRFNFVVISGFNDTSQYRSQVRDVQMVIDQPNFKVVKTNDFTYLKFKGGEVVNVNE